MRKLKTDRSSRRVVFIDGNARMSADEPFVGACDPEPCNDNGERSIAAMKLREMIAANTWYACGNTWRSPKGHTSRVDYVLNDAPRIEETKKTLWHRPYRGFDMRSCRRLTMCKVFNRCQR